MKLHGNISLGVLSFCLSITVLQVACERPGADLSGFVPIVVTLQGLPGRMQGIEITANGTSIGRTNESGELQTAIRRPDNSLLLIEALLNSTGLRYVVSPRKIKVTDQELKQTIFVTDSSMVDLYVVPSSVQPLKGCQFTEVLTGVGTSQSFSDMAKFDDVLSFSCEQLGRPCLFVNIPKDKLAKKVIVNAKSQDCSFECSVLVSSRSRIRLPEDCAVMEPVQNTQDTQNSQEALADRQKDVQRIPSMLVRPDISALKLKKRKKKQPRLVRLEKKRRVVSHTNVSPVEVVSDSRKKLLPDTEALAKAEPVLSIRPVRSVRPIDTVRKQGAKKCSAQNSTQECIDVYHQLKIQQKPIKSCIPCLRQADMDDGPLFSSARVILADIYSRRSEQSSSIKSKSQFEQRGIDLLEELLQHQDSYQAYVYLARFWYNRATRSNSESKRFGLMCKALLVTERGNGSVPKEGTGELKKQIHSLFSFYRANSAWQLYSAMYKYSNVTKRTSRQDPLAELCLSRSRLKNIAINQFKIYLSSSTSNESKCVAIKNLAELGVQEAKPRGLECGAS